MQNRIDINRLQNKLKFRQLVVFNQVLQTRSVLKASEKLGLTQPAVTRTIRDLELLFDTTLFERTNRGMRPTVFAEALRLRSRIMLAELRYLADEINALHGADEGHVVVGALVSTATKLLPQAVRLLKNHSPSVVVTIKEGPGETLVPALINGELDVIVGRIPDESLQGITSEVLYKEDLCVVVGWQNGLRNKLTLELSELADHQWIVPLTESPVRNTVNQMFAQAGLQSPTKIIESVSMISNIGLLSELNAIGVLPATVAKMYEALGSVCILQLREKMVFGEVGFSVASGRNLNPASKMFVNCLHRATSL